MRSKTPISDCKNDYRVLSFIGSSSLNLERTFVVQKPNSSLLVILGQGRVLWLLRFEGHVHNRPLSLVLRGVVL